MKNLKEELKFGKRGITLIALVVTIIVLLILAGVTIATLTGDNGILTKAQEAKSKTEEASVDELRKLTQVEATTHLEEYEYEDVNGEKITIPAQCAVSQVDEENILENGLVIIDSNGNEWVWIEVPKSEMPEGLTFENDVDYTTLESSLQTYTSDYSESGYIDEWYEGCGINNEEIYNLMYKKMLNSIYNKGGFWIGRYEAGSDTYVTEIDNGLRNLAIQKNKFPYNYVTVSTAEKLAESLSINNNSTSSLLFGIQWNLMCKFIEEKSVNIGIDKLAMRDIIKNDSTKYGNYSNASFIINNTQAKKSKCVQGTWELEDWTLIEKGYKKEDSGENNLILLSTGASDRNKLFNIYDIAGNELEFTLEKYENSSTPVVKRGGFFGQSRKWKIYFRKLCFNKYGFCRL